MRDLGFPRTWVGWRRLLWLSLGRCPVHHSPLHVDWPLYDDGRSAYCFECDGIGVWPAGPLVAMRLTAMTRAAERAARGDEATT